MLKLIQNFGNSFHLTNQLATLTHPQNVRNRGHIKIQIACLILVPSGVHKKKPRKKLKSSLFLGPQKNSRILWDFSKPNILTTF